MGHNQWFFEALPFSTINRHWSLLHLDGIYHNTINLHWSIYQSHLHPTMNHLNPIKSLMLVDLQWPPNLCFHRSFPPWSHHCAELLRAHAGSCVRCPSTAPPSPSLHGIRGAFGGSCQLGGHRFAPVHRKVTDGYRDQWENQARWFFSYLILLKKIPFSISFVQHHLVVSSVCRCCGCVLATISSCYQPTFLATFSTLKTNLALPWCGGWAGQQEQYHYQPISTMTNINPMSTIIQWLWCIIHLACPHVAGYILTCLLGRMIPWLLAWLVRWSVLPHPPLQGTLQGIRKSGVSSLAGATTSLLGISGTHRLKTDHLYNGLIVVI